MRSILVFSMLLALAAAFAGGCATSCGALGDLQDAALQPLDPPPAAPDAAAPAAAPPARAAAPPAQGAAPPEPPPPPASCGARLVVSELMIDPRATADNRGEYVELFNPGPAAVDLRGFRLDDGRHAPDVLGGERSLEIPAGGFAVLAPSDDEDANGGLSPIAVVRSFSLSNAAGLVRLHDPCGGVAARVRYDTRAPWPRSRAGVALELSSPDADPQRPQSWRRATARTASGDRGTPGWAPWPSSRASRGARGPLAGEAGTGQEPGRSPTASLGGP